jgi:RNA-binding protein
MPDLPDEGRTPAPAPPLSSAERRALRARAHELDPVVMIGDAGLTDAVVAETDRALGAHGLIKVRIFGDDRDARQAMAAELEARTGSALVQAIGKLVVLWRPRAQDTGPIGAALPAASTARARATLSVPKKLAAEGKAAPRRRVRPGVPRAPVAEPPPRRTRAPAGRAVGPGLRAARGALDPSVARPAPGGAASGVRGGRPPAAGARSAGGPGARAAGAGPAGRGSGSGSARGPGSGAARGPGSRGPAGTARTPGATPQRGGFGGPATRAGSGTAARGPGPGGAGRPAGRPPSSGTVGARGAAPARSRAGAGATGTRAPSPARSGAGAPRGTGRGGTPSTGSGRPGPRTRAGRRGP